MSWQHNPTTLNAIHVRLMRQIVACALPAELDTRDRCELQLLESMGLVVHSPNPGWHLTTEGRLRLVHEGGE